MTVRAITTVPFEMHFRMLEADLLHGVHFEICVRAGRRETWTTHVVPPEYVLELGLVERIIDEMSDALIRHLREDHDDEF